MVWTGKPIDPKARGSFVAFRKSFTLSQVPDTATLHLFADTRYVLWVNGHYCSRGPVRFEPAAPEYDSPEIAPLLHAGTNTFAILVNSRISNGRTRLHDPCLTAQLLTHAGRDDRLLLATDNSWKFNDHVDYRESRVDWPNIYDIVEATNDDGDWTQSEYDDSGWSNAVPIKSQAWGSLTPCRIPPLREATIEPQWQSGATFPITLHAGQTVSFKFPRLVLAYTNLEFEADAGTQIQLTWSPKTNYTARAGPQTYISTDTHSIFGGAIRVKSGSATLKRVTFVERLYPFTCVGSFHSSDPLLDKLWTTCVRGLEITSEDAYIDCADRERVEWMDCDPPAFDVTRIAMSGPPVQGKPTYADARLLQELLRRTACTLQPAGWVKAHTCSDRFDIHAKMEDRACDWVQGARRYYESTNDTAVIREIWPAIVAQMNYFLVRQSPRGLVLAREWVVWGDPVGYRTCEGTALNAFIYRALADAGFLGDLIGEHEQAARFTTAAADLAHSINAILWDEEAGTYYAGYDASDPLTPTRKGPPLQITNHLIEPTRHAALFTLDQGVVPPPRHSRVAAYLLAHPPTDDPVMQYYYYFKQQYAQDDPAQDQAVLTTLRTQWKDMANSRYEAGFEELHATNGSAAHCYGIFPAYFLSADVLGVRLDGPVQNKSLLIEPRLGDLTHAAGTVVTEFGPVSVAWNKTSDGWDFSATVPADVATHLHLPVGPGGFRATLDGRDVSSLPRVGRWLDVPLSSGKHAGTWKTI